MGPAIVEYLQRIDATLEPFGGRFIVHGGKMEVWEGAWPGHLIIIAFPDRERARAWYESSAYQEILPLPQTTPRVMSPPPTVCLKAIGQPMCWASSGASSLAVDPSTAFKSKSFFRGSDPAPFR
jgi:uncharacterized protein (DUF1330 family)